MLSMNILLMLDLNWQVALIAIQIQLMSYMYISADSKKSIFIPYVTEYEITSILAGINNSSPGWNNIKSVILKPCIKEYIKPLTYVINKSFETGKFPNLLKIAKIIPIFKSGDKTMVSNYRPISVLLVFAKVCEKIMANHLLEFLNSNNTLYKLQFVFENIFLLAILLFH